MTSILLLVTSYTKSCICFWLVYLTFEPGPWKRWSQGYAHFECEYLVNSDRWSKYYYCHHIESWESAFSWYIYVWPWSILNVKLRSCTLRLPFANISNDELWQIGETLQLLSYIKSYRICIGIFTFDLASSKGLVKVIHVLIVNFVLNDDIWQTYFVIYY